MANSYRLRQRLFLNVIIMEKNIHWFVLQKVLKVCISNMIIWDVVIVWIFRFQMIVFGVICQKEMRLLKYHLQQKKCINWQPENEMSIDYLLKKGCIIDFSIYNTAFLHFIYQSSFA